jgi:hypothetical protein
MVSRIGKAVTTAWLGTLRTSIVPVHCSVPLLPFSQLRSDHGSVIGSEPGKATS